MAGEDALSTSSGINTGDAQVFQPMQTDYFSKVATLKEGRRREKSARQGQIQKTLSTLDDIEIFPKHQQMFADKQKGIYDFAYNNIDALLSGDPTKTMEFQEQLQNFYNEANVSKGIKKNYMDSFQKYVTNPNKYRQSTVDYLSEFTGLDETGQMTDLDPTKFREFVDYRKHVTDDLLPLVQKIGEGPEYEVFDSKSGNYVRGKTHAWSLRKAEDTIRKDVQSNPLYLDQAVDEFNQLSPEEQKQYKNPTEYFVQKHARDLVYDKSSRIFSTHTGSDNYTNEDVNMTPQQINYSPTTFNPLTGQLGETNSTFTTYGKVTHKNPYPVNISISPKWVTKSGNKKVKEGANVDLDLGETMIVPVYKSGSTMEQNGKKFDLSGTIIPSDLEDDNKQKGKVEYKVYTSATDMDGNSYMIPSDEVKKPLTSKKVPLETLKNTAKQLNSSGNTVERKTKDGRIAIFDADTKQFIKYK